jgi:6-phosphogluconolactonase (cycloisomerase 2 family)
LETYATGDLVFTSQSLSSGFLICGYIARNANIGVWPGTSSNATASSDQWMALDTNRCVGLIQPPPPPPPGSGIEFAYAHTGNAIYQYSVSTDGTLQPLVPASVSTGTGGGFMAIDSVHHILYAANYVDGYVSIFSIGSDGRLSPAAKSYALTGANPYYVIVDGAGQNLYVGGPSESDHFSIAADGSLGPITPTPYSNTTGAPGAIVAINPQGNYLLGWNQWLAGWTYSDVQAADGTITTVKNFQRGMQSKPVFDSTGNYLYLNGGSQLTTNSFGSDGTISQIAAISFYSDPQLAINPVSPYLYAAVSGNSQGTYIHSYSIGADGRLAQSTLPTQVLSTDAFTRIAVDPLGKFMYAVTWSPSVVYQYAIGPNGVLSALPAASTAIASGQYVYDIQVIQY